eukprot:1159043-Pelagomonas_calceolata.AAC.5
MEDGLVAASGGVVLGCALLGPLTSGGAPNSVAYMISGAAALTCAAVAYVCQPVTRFKLRGIPGEGSSAQVPE